MNILGFIFSLYFSLYALGAMEKQRTPEINLKISQAFERLEEHTSSSWGLFNGEDKEYHLCAISEWALIKKIIQESPHRKEFYVLDIGAGNFQWGRGVSKFINAQENIPSNIILHIFNIRGESSLTAEIVQEGYCKIYNYGKFKVESLKEEFLKRNQDLDKKFDLIISRWCFRHLVDPLGTFSQAYNLLRPQTGQIIMDGFYYLPSYKEVGSYIRSIEPDKYMAILLLNTNAPFLILPHRDARSLYQFVLRRPDDHPWAVGLNYDALVSVDAKNMDQFSGSITKFVFNDQESAQNLESLIKLSRPRYYETGDGNFVGLIYGNKNLYNWYNERSLFGNNTMTNELYNELEASNFYQMDPKLFHNCMLAWQPLL